MTGRWNWLSSNQDATPFLARSSLFGTKPDATAPPSTPCLRMAGQRLHRRLGPREPTVQCNYEASRWWFESIGMGDPTRLLVDGTGRLAPELTKMPSCMFSCPCLLYGRFSNGHQHPRPTRRKQ